jgi:hypothetical protein
MIGVVAVAAAAFALSSCGLDSGFNSVADFDVVITVYDDTADFGALNTYAMPDSVAHLDVLAARGDDARVSRAYDRVILDEVASNLEAAGYEREESPEENGADFVVLVSVTSTDWEVWASYGWYDYWGWYGGWDYWGGYPGYGYYYPPCYECGTVTEFSTGSIIIDMLDVNNADEQNEIMPIIWTAGINGLLEGTVSSVSDRIVDNVEQAFAQSPYLEAD